MHVKLISIIIIFNKLYHIIQLISSINQFNTYNHHYLFTQHIIYRKFDRIRFENVNFSILPKERAFVVPELDETLHRTQVLIYISEKYPRSKSRNLSRVGKRCEKGTKKIGFSGD